MQRLAQRRDQQSDAQHAQRPVATFAHQRFGRVGAQLVQVSGAQQIGQR